MTMPPRLLPTMCDYLVVGGGATGMSFCDTLFRHYDDDEIDNDNDNDASISNNKKALTVVMIDKHSSPGGQWHDSYSFVQLHQPSAMYGVESEALETTTGGTDHRATRTELLSYYQSVQTKLEAHPKHNFYFVGGATFDVTQLQVLASSSKTTQQQSCSQYHSYSFETATESGKPLGCTIHVTKRVVDARYLEPDIPVSVAPRFLFDSKAISCVPVNALAAMEQPYKRYVVIGGGKTGMDAITHLLQHQRVSPSDIVWVVPNDVWITARENIGGCMEFLHTCTSIAKQTAFSPAMMKKLVTAPDFLQKGFLEWEKLGRVYRLTEGHLPTKFKDATLDRHELTLLKQVGNVVRHHGRVVRIHDEGILEFVDGFMLNILPAEGSNQTVQDVLFVHCSAGAFHYTKQQQQQQTPPTFSNHQITIQDVYGTPGFCFVGSIVAMMECLSEELNDSQKNEMLLAPPATPADKNDDREHGLGPSGGEIGSLSRSHGYVQRVTNLRSWLQQPKLRSFLLGHRLFNLGHYPDMEKVERLVEEIWQVLTQAEIV